MTQVAHPMRKRPTTFRTGFTLIESIATIAILAVLGTIGSSMILTAATSWRDAAATAQLHDELSTALERIAKELRSIDRDASAPAAAADISALTATSITYNTNSSISLSGTNLRLVDSGAAPINLLSNVSAVAIRAFDDSNAALSDSIAGVACRDIRRIEVQVTLQRSGVTHTLRTRLFLRSTMSGAAS